MASEQKQFLADLRAHLKPRVAVDEQNMQQEETKEDINHELNELLGSIPDGDKKLKVK